MCDSYCSVPHLRSIEHRAPVFTCAEHPPPQVGVSTECAVITALPRRLLIWAGNWQLTRHAGTGSGRVGTNLRCEWPHTCSLTD